MKESLAAFLIPIVTAAMAAIPSQARFHYDSTSARVVETEGRLTEGGRVIIPGEAPLSEGMKVRVAEK